MLASHAFIRQLNEQLNQSGILAKATTVSSFFNNVSFETILIMILVVVVLVIVKKVLGPSCPDRIQTRAEVSPIITCNPCSNSSCFESIRENIRKSRTASQRSVAVGHRKHTEKDSIEETRRDYSGIERGEGEGGGRDEDRRRRYEIQLQEEKAPEADFRSGRRVGRMADYDKRTQTPFSAPPRTKQKRFEWSVYEPPKTYTYAPRCQPARATQYRRTALPWVYDVRFERNQSVHQQMEEGTYSPQNQFFREHSAYSDSEETTCHRCGVSLDGNLDELVIDNYRPDDPNKSPA